MTIEEIKQKVFGYHQNEAIINNYETIKNYFSTKTDIAVIDVRGVEGEDVTQKREDPTYLIEENLVFTENGIKTIIATPETVELLKNALPRTVKSLTIPSTMLNDLSFLKEFPNLEELTISDYSIFDREELEYIRKNTNIKIMNFRSPATINKIKGQPNCHVIDAGKKIASVNGLILKSDSYNNKWSKNIYFNTNTYEELSELTKLYQMICHELDDIETIKLTKGSDDIVCGTGHINTRNPDKMQFSFSELSPKEVSTIYKGMKKDKIKEIKYNCNTKIFEELLWLKEIAQNHDHDFTINYPGGTKATYEEFLNMRATMDYYKEILSTSNLSPTEQVAAVYDILKTMRYKENQEDKQRSRNIHGIVADGTIVCVGYSIFAKYLLEEIGIKSTTVSLELLEQKEYHERNFVRIDDDKYNIHGVFAMDITWDSDKDVSVIEEDDKKQVIARPSEELKDKIVDKYDSLVLYRYFLIPMDQYEQRFPNEKNPKLFEEYKKDKGKELALESRASEEKKQPKNAYVLSQHEELFTNDEGPLTVAKYLSAPKPSLETFKEIITNARRAEGYNAQQAEHDVERVLELQNMLKEQNPDGPDTFFKPTTK